MPGHDGCKSLAVHWLLLGAAGTVEDVVDGGLLGEVVVVALAVVAVVEDLLAEFLGELEHPASSTTAKAVMVRKAGRFAGWTLPNEGKPTDRAIRLFAEDEFNFTMFSRSGGHIR